MSGWDGEERSSIIVGLVGFRVERVDVTGSTAHPQKDNRFVVANGFPIPLGMIAGPKQIGQGQARHARQTRFQHAPPIHYRQTFAFGTVKVRERVPIQVLYSV